MSVHTRLHHTLPRHGIAMLLVLISVATASVLVVAYVASRDNSGLISDNVSSSASARWTADSGLEMSLAMLQTQADWRTSHNAGKLVDDYVFEQASLDIDLLDLETGVPPTSKTEHVKVTAAAQSNGVQQASTAIAYVPITAAADIDLSEFAIFATERIELTHDAVVTRWPRAALSTLGEPVALGTQATNVGAIGIYNCAAPIDTQVFAGPAASSSLVSCSNGMDPPLTKLLDMVPMPDTPSSNVPAPTALDALLLPVMNVLNGVGTIVSTTRVTNATLGNTVRTLQGAISLISNDDLTMTNSKLLINGNVKIVVFDDLIMQNSSIELMPGARLTMYLGDAVNLQDSFMGEQRSNSLRDNTGMAAPFNAKRIRIFRLPQSGAGAAWALRQNSVVKASIYAPRVQFEIRDQSALYGRVAAKRVDVREQGAVFYDPALNRRTGFTEPSSVLFQSDGQLLSAVKTMTTLDQATLQSIADACNIELKAATDENILIKPTGAIDPTISTTGPTEPTPRPTKVEYRIMSHGTSVTDWEQQAN
jgi:hypothetical protein